tara:strand:- start:18206 stop:18814 length:609 start_codon:yes stop_codon:yes gene_type:complete
MSLAYSIPDGTTEVCYEIKKSRFIARLLFATDREQAMQALERAKQDYSDARHHCWAYQIGSPTSPHLAAMSDDGEPSGTAGKPILNVIQHKDVGDVMLIVIRYFGGIKLGAGGLVRAYSQAAQMAFDAMKTKRHVELDEFSLVCDFQDEQSIRHWLKQYESNVQSVDYEEQVTMHISMDGQYEAELVLFLATLKKACLKSTG